MRNLSEAEVLSLTGLLKLDQDSLTLTKAMQTLIKDEEMKKTCEGCVMAAETRVRGIQQFILENQVANIQEVQ